MRPLLPLLLAGLGCSPGRFADFGDCWKAEVPRGGGLWILGGPLLHTGIGPYQGTRYLPYQPLGGWRYGYAYPPPTFDGEYPQEAFAYIFHARWPNDAHDTPSSHQCFALLPPLLSKEGVHSYLLHDFDLEVGAGLAIGLSLGFSLGEFLDFLLGCVGIDLADDDSEDGRRSRNDAASYHRARVGQAPLILPKGK